MAAWCKCHTAQSPSTPLIKTVLGGLGKFLGSLACLKEDLAQE